MAVKPKVVKLATKLPASEPISKVSRVDDKLLKAIDHLEKEIILINEKLLAIETRLLESETTKRDLIKLLIKLERTGLIEHSVVNSFGSMQG